MTYDCTMPEDVLRTIKDHKIQMIDLRFTDLPGRWQHFSVPPSALDLESFEGGVRFDGSSIRWFQEIQESEMRVIPDPASAFLDPFTEIPTLVLICNVRDPVTGQSYTRDPRYIAQKAEAYLLTTQIGNAADFAIELEHLVFNGARNAQSTSYDDHEVGRAKANCSAARRGAAQARTISCARRTAISRFRRTTSCRRSARSWSRPSRRSASRSGPAMTGS